MFQVFCSSSGFFFFLIAVAPRLPTPRRLWYVVEQVCVLIVSLSLPSGMGIPDS